jgi:hypothetical protein
MSDPLESLIGQLQYIQFFEGVQKSLILHASSPLVATDNYFKELLTFAHYQLPTADGPEVPTSLALAHMRNGERLLVRKKYIDGPQPSANIHLLVGFPPSFLVRDAIMFWNTSFWDANLHEKVLAQDKKLPSLAFHTLKKYVDELSPFSFLLPISPADRRAADACLPFLLQFFLLQQVYLERRDAGEKRPVPRILINLAADQVAYLIYALSRLLPFQLLNTTTFNTYEHDLHKQFYTICGTGLTNLASHKSDDFILESAVQSEPQALYRDSISSVLRDKIANYASQATRWFKPDMSLASEASAFLLGMEASPQLSVEAFLTQCERFGRSSTSASVASDPSPDSGIAKTVQPVIRSGSGKLPLPAAPITVEKQLLQPDLSSEENADATTVGSREETQSKAQEMLLAAKREKDALAEAPAAHSPDETKGVFSFLTKPQKPLSPHTIIEEFAKGPEKIRELVDEESRRQYVINLVLQDPKWFQKQLLDQLKAWFKIAPETSKGRKSLGKFLQSVTTISIHVTHQGRAAAFHNSIWLLAYLPVLLHDHEDAWRSLLWTLCHEQNYEVFLQDRWFSREFLLNIAARVLYYDTQENEDMITPLLKVTPAEIGKLLIVPVSPTQTLANAGTHALRFRVSRWSYVAIKLFVFVREHYDAVLPPEVIQYFNQHHELVRVLFTESGSLEAENGWRGLAYFFNLLARSGYQYKDDLITYLISNHLSIKEVEVIVVCLLEHEQDAFFQLYENLCIEYFPASEIFREITQRCLPALPLTWQRISNLDLMFNKLRKQPKVEIYTLVPDLAQLLDACVDGPMSLGMLFPSLLRLEASLVSELFLRMASLARHAIEEQLVFGESKRSNQSDENARKSIAHFSSYVQFALRFESIYDRKNIARDLHRNLLDTLLNKAPEHVFVLISNEARYWPADLYTDWEYIAKPYRTPPSPPPPPLPDRRQLSREEEQVIAQIDRLIKKGGARKLGLFWLEHSILLYALGKELINDPNTTADAATRWSYLRAAYDFYVACKKAEYSKKDSQALQKAEQEIVDIERRNQNFLRLSRKENARVKRAQQRLPARTDTPIQGDN